ncbi:hypothetical protein FOA52_013788 [Chlamydomonas sp. UWO 241]|nr:hypothetical protein FOA52_013788 [Chlamydomonas sp. UWO 241]
MLKQIVATQRPLLHLQRGSVREVAFHMVSSSIPAPLCSFLRLSGASMREPNDAACAQLSATGHQADS